MNTLTNLERIKEIRERFGVGLYEAKRMQRKEEMLRRLHQATTVSDLRDLLIAWIEQA
jgi:ribosomal protein L7/L12